MLESSGARSRLPRAADRPALARTPGTGSVRRGVAAPGRWVDLQPRTWPPCRRSCRTRPCRCGRRAPRRSSLGPSVSAAWKQRVACNAALASNRLTCPIAGDREHVAVVDAPGEHAVRDAVRHRLLLQWTQHLRRLTADRSDRLAAQVEQMADRQWPEDEDAVEVLVDGDRACATEDHCTGRFAVLDEHGLVLEPCSTHVGAEDHRLAVRAGGDGGAVAIEEPAVDQAELRQRVVQRAARRLAAAFVQGLRRHDGTARRVARRCVDGQVGEGRCLRLLQQRQRHCETDRERDEQGDQRRRDRRPLPRAQTVRPAQGSRRPRLGRTPIQHALQFGREQAAVAKRWRGSLASALCTTLARSRPAAGCSLRSSTGSSVRIRRYVSSRPLPTSGGRSVRHSYSIAPSACTSVRRSTRAARRPVRAPCRPACRRVAAARQRRLVVEQVAGQAEVEQHRAAVG